MAHTSNCVVTVFVRGEENNGGINKTAAANLAA